MCLLEAETVAYAERSLFGGYIPFDYFLKKPMRQFATDYLPGEFATWQKLSVFREWVTFYQ